MVAESSRSFPKGTVMPSLAVVLFFVHDLNFSVGVVSRGVVYSASCEVVQIDLAFKYRVL